MTIELSAADRRTLHLAKVALIAEMGGARAVAVKALERIDAECGEGAIDLAMCSWIDTLAALIGMPRGRPIQLAFVDSDRPDAVMTGAEVVDRPEVVWAGRLSAARIAGDTDTYGALIETLPEDPAEVGKHVGAVLEGCALTLARYGVTP
ncbi:hypothetical protein [Actinomadura nitritigenes]|uniref:hypothetical protein n=1 Tax=Actinomadura nitritigenes TaxID=134602 RepID=UPI003D9069E4